MVLALKINVVFVIHFFYLLLVRIVASHVQELHRPEGGLPGPAERAGVALGDVILGINYEPLERGLVHTADTLANAIKLAGFVKLQVYLPLGLEDKERVSKYGGVW